jgi:two-component system nitrate/nitrite response regulator NarL
MSAANVFLIDANRLFREGMRRLFADSAFTVVGEAGSAGDAVQAMESSPVELGLILIDPLSDAAEEIGKLQSVAPQARIVVLTTDLCPRHLSAALGAGAQGYLLKDIACESLMQSLTLVMMGEKVFPTNLADLLVSSRPSGIATAIPGQRAGLSQREIQILRCLVNGSSNKMIAIHLNITEATVKVHLKSLLRKINASNRTQAAIWAMSNGFDQQEDAPLNRMVTV